MRTVRLLNLGAGVQSTTVYLLAREGVIPPFDAAIFADTMDEPQAVYAHLAWLQSLASPPIIVRSAGCLGDHLKEGRNSTGGRFASIPAFTAPHHATRSTLVGCQEGRTQRQCSKEYKTEVVERALRRDVLGLGPRRRIPSDTVIAQHFGISLDERRRADRIRGRLAKKRSYSCHFPLIELGWRRGDCEDYLKTRVPHQVPRSACVFCPYRSAAEWLAIKAKPQEWARAVEIDEALRRPGNVVNRTMDKALYLHRTCLPLVDVDLEAEAAKAVRKRGPDLFALYACEEGVCGV